MALFTQFRFNATGIRSLCWRGDQLIDWVAGGRAFAADGTEQAAKVIWGYRFDAATASPDGRFVVIYERLGTKGLLLRDGKILREINRSYNFAATYEYPAVLFNDPDGRVLFAHCPGNYGRIELEDAETGQPLTASEDRKPSSFFHSRLAASPHGKRLLSAGWIWHPLSLVTCFDVVQALADPWHLDGAHYLPSSLNPGLAAESSACWLDDDCIAVAASADPEEDSVKDDTAPRLRPCGIAVYDLANRTLLQALQLDEPPGTIIPLGRRHLLSLYRHPKLIDLSTGKVIHVWTELQSGLQDGSIVSHLNDDAKPPPMAFDSANNRFAIVNRDAVTVIEFNRSALSGGMS